MKLLGALYVPLAGALLIHGPAGSRAAEENPSRAAALAEALVSADGDEGRKALLAAEPGVDLAELQEVLVTQGRHLLREGRYREGRARLEVALGLGGPYGDPASAARFLINVAQARGLTGDTAAVLEILPRVRAAAVESGDKAELARFLNFSAGVRKDQGDFAGAREEYLGGLAAAEDARNDKIAAAVLHNIGFLALDENDPVRALEYCRRSVARFEAAGDEWGTVLPIITAGNAQLALGDYGRALAEYGRAAVRAERTKHQAGLAVAIENVGLIHHLQSNPAQAVEHLLRARRMAEDLGAAPTLAHVLVTLGHTYLDFGRHEAAVRTLEEALELARRLELKDQEALALAGIGHAHARRGDFVRALESQEAALGLARGIGHKSFISQILLFLADTRNRMGAPQEALAAARRALAAAEEIGSLEEAWVAHHLAGRAYRRLGKSEEARASFAEAIRAIERLRHQAVGGLEDRQRFLEDKVEAYQELVELELESDRVGEALSRAEAAKGRVLLDVLRGRGARPGSSLTADERDREQRAAAALRTANRLVFEEAAKSLPDAARLAELRAGLERARLEYEAFETSLYAAHPELRLERGEVDPFRLEEADALLPDHRTVLLEFVVGEERTHLFVVSREGPSAPPALTAHRIEVRREDLQRRVQAFRQRLAERSPDFRHEARDFYGLLLDPARDRISGKAILGLVPDGVLWELPFQVLESRRGRPLLADHAVFYAPSLGILREMRAAPASRPVPGRPRLLALANPSLAADPQARERAAHRGLDVGALPDAEDEVRQLRRLYGPGRSAVYVGDAAREDRLKGEIGGYDVVHVAAHAVLDDASPLYSHVLLAGGEGAEDGLLEAWEVMRLNVPAGLVVLSACQTARGRLGPGEGIVGMAWAFFVAGCPTTVVSQWAVDSASTRELMVEFHRRLLRGSGGMGFRAEALRQAALRVSRRPGRRHPFHWAGFIVMGDGGRSRQ